MFYVSLQGIELRQEFAPGFKAYALYVIPSGGLLAEVHDWARKIRGDKSFLFNVTDDKNYRNSPTHAGYFGGVPIGAGIRVRIPQSSSITDGNGGWTTRMPGAASYIGR